MSMMKAKSSACLNDKPGLAATRFASCFAAGSYFNLSRTSEVIGMKHNLGPARIAIIKVLIS